MELIAGVDEVGRGPLAGPVIAAVVILDPDHRINGIRDSKMLTAAQREALAPRIKARAIAYAIGRAEVAEIEQYNIFRASLLAMRRAILALPQIPTKIFIDGTHCPPDLPCPAEAIVDGDKKMRVIGAASIIAKVARDQEMIELDSLYPGYGFAQHKGYSTPEHIAALQKLGPCAIHRRSFTRVLQTELAFMEHDNTVKGEG